MLRVKEGIYSVQQGYKGISKVVTVIEFSKMESDRDETSYGFHIF